MTECMKPDCHEPALCVFTRHREPYEPLDIYACPAHVMALAVLETSFGAICEDFRRSEQNGESNG